MVPSGIQEKIGSFLQKRWEGGKKVYGLQGGARAYLLSLVAERKNQPLLVVTPTTREAENLFLDLAFFLGEEKSLNPLQKRLHLFPAWEILPFEKLSPHPDNVAARLEGLYYLLEGQAPILISTPAALMQKVVPKESLKESYLYLVIGDEISREDFLEHLVGWGFQGLPLVEERGDFSVRGGVVDVFPPAYNQPIRLEFCDDRLESIRSFDPSTQRSQTSHQELLLLPMKEFSLKGRSIKETVRDIERRAEELELGRKEKNAVLESLKDGIPFPGIEFLVPHFYSTLSSLFSYLPRHTLVWLDQAAQVEAEAGRFECLTAERIAKVKEEGYFAPPVERLYLDEKAWRECLSVFPQVCGEALDTIRTRGKTFECSLAVNSRLNTDLHQEIFSIPGREPSLAPLVERLKEWKEDRVFFVAPTPADAARLSEMLAHYGVPLPLVKTPVPQLLSHEKPLHGILVGELTQGFRLLEDHLILIVSDEIFSTKKRQRTRFQKGQPSHFITTLTELKQDDYVVHLDNGIGIYRGLKFLQVAGVGGEFIHLEYEGGDRLYLPIDRINLIQKYIGGDGAQATLDRLGGTSWERIKAKTHESILAMAQDLIEVSASREVQGGYAYAPPEQLYREFEASFDFEETPDQERAIQDTLEDMQKKKSMDRLICGDVGFGKTEVALRAAFLAVMSGKQVAVLAPTTILAEQHLETFRHRFRNYPVRVEMLSRFLAAKESQRVIQGLGKGVIDIVIGTHRLLQKTVQFQDLGLVVIDEEHRFGVAHKERLKKLRHLVDVLSLTATPIPRTLHMSLIGIRDMSIIESPPLDRLAIRTYITSYDEGIIRDAVLREIQRGGQVFFLHNRVETISRVAQKLSDVLPEVKIAVAHGQMRPRELEKVMIDFSEDRTQMLVCSAIIESGLDFPNANTIIINRADKFGIAQLYQLRGRVGRSHRRAYAYLLIPGGKIISRDAERRLRALQEIDELGGGFKLAVHDLEIRGTGNLLGRQQSGQIRAVGFELYTQMMKEAVQKLKGEKVKVEIEPEIRLGIPAYFPQPYIPDTNQRLLFYKRLANLGDLQDLDGLKEELKDRYGPFSSEVENLFLVMCLRRILKDTLVKQISYHEGRLSLLFHPQSPVSAERLFQLIGKKNSRYHLSPEGRLSFSPQNQAWEKMIPEVMRLLRAIH